MLHLSAEEWAHLSVFPPFSKFMTQLKAEVDEVQDQLGNGHVLSRDAQETAINYAVTTGRLLTLKEILGYKPRKEEETQDD